MSTEIREGEQDENTQDVMGDLLDMVCENAWKVVSRMHTRRPISFPFQTKLTPTYTTCAPRMRILCYLNFLFHMFC